MDVLIPSFSDMKYFWFVKSFKTKPKSATLEQQVKGAEKSHAEALKQYNKLEQMSDEETVKAVERLEQAELALIMAKQKLKSLGKKK